MATSGSPAGQAERFARGETHRLFFALMPEAAQRQAISDAARVVQQQHPQLRARWVKPERFHTTLNFLGDYPAVPDDVLEKAMTAAGGLKAEPFSWTLDYAASFRGREPPCVLRATLVPEPLLALWRDLQASLAHAGLRLRAEHPFTPHVTLAYGRQALPMATPITPITWRVERFVLIHNVVGRGHYQILGGWELSALQADGPEVS